MDHRVRRGKVDVCGVGGGRGSPPSSQDMRVPYSAVQRPLQAPGGATYLQQVTKTQQYSVLLE